jgi:small subunit ribosomal protein S3
MGQKVNPISLRIGINQNWRSRWFAPKKEYWKLLNEDIKVRDFVKEKLFYSGVSKIEIERVANRIRLIIHTARPGLVIGRKGAEIDNLKEAISSLSQSEVYVDIVEVKQPVVEAQFLSPCDEESCSICVICRSKRNQAFMFRALGGSRNCTA